MVFVRIHLKGVAVSIDGATMEGQCIQTSIVLNAHMGFTQKGVLNCCALLTRVISWHSTKGVLSDYNKNVMYRIGQQGSDHILKSCKLILLKLQS